MTESKGFDRDFEVHVTHEATAPDVAPGTIQIEAMVSDDLMPTQNGSYYYFLDIVGGDVRGGVWVQSTDSIPNGARVKGTLTKVTRQEMSEKGHFHKFKLTEVM